MKRLTLTPARPQQPCHIGEGETFALAAISLLKTVNEAPESSPVGVTYIYEALQRLGQNEHLLPLTHQHEDFCLTLSEFVPSILPDSPATAPGRKIYGDRDGCKAAYLVIGNTVQNGEWDLAWEDDSQLIGYCASRDPQKERPVYYICHVPASIPQSASYNDIFVEMQKILEEANGKSSHYPAEAQAQLDQIYQGKTLNSQKIAILDEILGGPSNIYIGSRPVSLATKVALLEQEYLQNIGLLAL